MNCFKNELSLYWRQRSLTFTLKVSWFGEVSNSSMNLLCTGTESFLISSKFHHKVNFRGFTVPWMQRSAHPHAANNNIKMFMRIFICVIFLVLFFHSFLKLRNLCRITFRVYEEFLVKANFLENFESNKFQHVHSLRGNKRQLTRTAHREVKFIGNP